MSADNIELMLILKYGSMAKAFRHWMVDVDNTFSKAETDCLAEYSTRLFPNLKLVRRTRK